MKSSILIRLGFLFVLVPLSLFGQTQDPYFDHLTPSSNGQSLTVVHCICQDSQGFIWITSPYGLARYDGNEYLIFQHQEDNPHSLIDNQLFSVFEDSKENLWITTDQGLELLDKKTGRFIQFQHNPNDPNSLPSNNLRTITEDKDGYLWIGTLNAGVCRFDFKSKTFKNYRNDLSNPNSPSSNSVWAICCDRNGKIWMGTHEGLLDGYDKQSGQWTHINLLAGSPNPSGNSNVWDMCEARDGKIYIGTSDIGLVILNPDSGSMDHIQLKQGSHCHKIFSLLEDQEGMIWIASQNGGIFRFNPKDHSLNQYLVNTMKPGSLSDNTVITIFEDREGLLWFGTSKGISLLNKHRFRFALAQYTPQTLEGLTGNNITALYEDRDGIVWIGTDPGGLNTWARKENKWNQINLPENISESFRTNPIQAFCEDHQGNIWIGNHRGLYVYERQHKTITHIQNTRDFIRIPRLFSPSAMAKGENEFIWIGTTRGELFKWDTIEKEAHLYTNPQQKIYKAWYMINEIYQDREGGIWIGTQWHGVDHLNPQNNNWIHYRRNPEDPSSFPSLTAYSITEDRTGKIWVGTEAGPCYLDPNGQNWHLLTELKQLPDDSAYGLLTDDSDWIWMSTKSGLIHIDPLSLKWRVFGPEDGLQDQIFNPGVCFQSRNGEMYFGGISGFNYFNPEAIQINLHPPQVAITSFQKASQNQETVLLGRIKSLKFSKDDLPVLIKMSALSFAFPQKNHYRVKALSSKPTEIYAGPQNSFFLRHLKAGKNRLLIQASNHDRTWDEKGIELTVYLSSPFTQYVLFISLGLILAAAAVLSLYIKRRKKPQAQPINGSEVDLARLSEHFNLTNREKEITALVISGKTNKEIEKELFISLKTVKSHLYNVYQKLNVQNRLQLMNIFRYYSNKN